jgi:hypothetical protein
MLIRGIVIFIIIIFLQENVVSLSLDLLNLFLIQSIIMILFPIKQLRLFLIKHQGQLSSLYMVPLYYIVDKN